MIVISEKWTAFLSFIEYEYPKRDAFSDCMIVISRKRITFCAFIIIKMVFGGTYSSCLYLLFLSWYKKRRQKKIKASSEAGETGRIHDENRKRDAFSGNMVGAYCIRPTNVPSMERMTWKRITFCAFAILGMASGGAYAIRPYPNGRKIITPKPCYLVGSEKRAAFRTCYLVGSEKRAAFGTCYLVGSVKRAAFGTCYLVGGAKRAAFGTCYLVGSEKRAAFGTCILDGGAKRAAFESSI